MSDSTYARLATQLLLAVAVIVLLTGDGPHDGYSLNGRWRGSSRQGVSFTTIGV